MEGGRGPDCRSARPARLVTFSGKCWCKSCGPLRVPPVTPVLASVAPNDADAMTEKARNGLNDLETCPLPTGLRKPWHCIRDSMRSWCVSLGNSTSGPSSAKPTLLHVIREC